jgi:hypothetical protein
MKWHDENPERWHEHSLMAAIDQGFGIDKQYLSALYKLREKGWAHTIISWELTDAGKAEYERVWVEIKDACEEERKMKGSD